MVKSGYNQKDGNENSLSCVLTIAYLSTMQYYEVGVKRSFDTYDTRLLRTSYSRNLQNIRNPLIFL